MKTILVTGGTGFIGSHTCLSLLEKNFRIIVIDSFVNSSISSFNRIYDIFFQFHNKQLNKESLIFQRGDIRDEDFLNQTFELEKKRGHEIDAVIHFAGLKSVSESIKYPLEYWDANVIGSICLLKVMRNYGCRTLVFSSSATIYGEFANGAVIESAKIKPKNPYGKTKVAIEKILMDVFESEKNEWRIANLRYFNPIGAHSSGLIGEHPLEKPNNLFPFITRVASGIYEKLKIFGNDWPTSDGTCVRDYIHVMDLANAHLEALNYLFKNNSKLINLNIGTGKGTSVLELVHTFEEVNKLTIPYLITDRREGDIASLVADNSLAIELLKWSPKYSIQDMCKDGWRWQKLNPKGFEG